MILALSPDSVSCGFLRFLGKGGARREREAEGEEYSSGTEVCGSGKSQGPVLEWRHRPRGGACHSGYGVVETEKVVFEKTNMMWW